MHDEADIFCRCDGCGSAIGYGNACVTITRNIEQVDRDEINVIESTDLATYCAACGNQVVVRTDALVKEKRASDEPPIFSLPLPCPWLSGSAEEVDEIEGALSGYLAEVSEREIAFVMDFVGGCCGYPKIMTVPHLHSHLPDWVLSRFREEDMECEFFYEWRGSGEHLFMFREGLPGTRRAALLCALLRIIGDPVTFANIREEGAEHGDEHEDDAYSGRGEEDEAEDDLGDELTGELAAAAAYAKLEAWARRERERLGLPPGTRIPPPPDFVEMMVGEFEGMASDFPFDDYMVVIENGVLKTVRKG